MRFWGKRLKRVNVIGWFNHSNIGDEAYKLAFPKLFPDASFNFSESTSGACDSCILGGGDVLYPHLVDALLKSKAQKRFIISVSVNPAIAPFEKLKEVDQILVRDRQSVEILKSHDVCCSWMPDIATILEPDRKRGLLWLKQQFQEQSLSLYEKRVGIVFNSYLHNRGIDREFFTFHKVVSELAEIADTTSASFIFFPMSTQLPYDDRITNGLIASKCKFWQKNLMIHDVLTVQNVLDLVSACDVIITSRLHSLIFSIVGQVPFVSTDHHDKIKCYLKTINLPWACSYWAFDSGYVKKTLSDMLVNPASYQAAIREVKENHLKVIKDTCKSLQL